MKKQDLIKKFEDALDTIHQREDFNNFGSARKTMEYALSLALQLDEHDVCKYIKVKDNEQKPLYCKCSHCNNIFDYYFKAERYKFCPSCGFEIIDFVSSNKKEL